VRRREADPVVVARFKTPRIAQQTVVEAFDLGLMATANNAVAADRRRSQLLGPTSSHVKEAEPGNAEQSLAGRSGERINQ